MRIPDPKATPDPTLTQVIADVNALAGEYGRPKPYFKQIGINYEHLVAAIDPIAKRSANASHRAMADDEHGLVSEDHLRLIVNGAIMRGIAYGLELANRRP